MKKRIAVLLLVVLCFGMLFGCSGTGDGSETTVNTETSTQTTGDLVTEIAGNTENIIENTTGVATGINGSEDSAKQILVDNPEVAVKIMDCATDANNGFIMNTYLENKTDSPVIFKVTASALNGKDMHPAFTQEVKAGESMTAPMVWSADKLAERQVTVVEEVKIELQIVSYGAEIKEISTDIYTIIP